MLDTTPVTTAIARLIASGVAERELLATVARRFPDLSLVKFSVALQTATAAAERKVARAKH
jgi:hypothetical protein